MYVAIPTTPAGWTLQRNAAGSVSYVPTVPGSNPPLKIPPGYTAHHTGNGAEVVFAPVTPSAGSPIPSVAPSAPTSSTASSGATVASTAAGLAVPIALLVAGFIFRRPWWGAVAATGAYFYQHP